jgi:antitoxin component YwqK of YwqJK toxin-antitoxin module
MKPLLLLLFAAVFLTNCSEKSRKYIQERTSTTRASSNDFVGEWKFNKNLIGKRIDDQISRSSLMIALEGAIERNSVRPFDDFIVFDEILQKIQFFEYQKVRFGEILYDTYFVKVELEEEDDELNLVFIVNPDKNAMNSSLIIYEHCKNESELIRKAYLNFPFIKTIGLRDNDSLINQKFILVDGDFLDYFDNDSRIDRHFSFEGFDYLSKGNVKNHLKSGYWEEQSFTVKQSSTICQKTTKGKYKNGLKDGAWTEVINSESASEKITSKGQYRNGRKFGQWKTSFRNKRVLSIQFTENTEPGTYHRLNNAEDTNKSDDLKMMGGVYEIQTLVMNEETHEITQTSIVISINENAFVDFDSKSTNKEGEYTIDALTNTDIYCTKKNDFGSLDYFQINFHEGKFHIKGNMFFIDQWIPIEQTYNL